MTSEPVLKVAVLGSCSTRDSFNTRFNPNYKQFYQCTLIQNQSSIISLMSAPVTLTEDQYGDITPYNRREVDADLSKAFLSRVVEEAPDYVILDFFADVHFGVLQISDGQYLTNNRWKLWLTDYYAQLKRDGRLRPLRFDDDSDAYFDRWREAFDRLVAFLREHLTTTTFVVHRGRNTGLLALPDQDLPVPLAEHRPISPLDVERANQWWARLDDYAIESTGFSAIDLTDREYATFDAHPWGAFYVHYTLDYYADFLAALHRIHLAQTGLHPGETRSRMVDDLLALSQVAPRLENERLLALLERRQAELTEQRHRITRLEKRVKLAEDSTSAPKAAATEQPPHPPPPTKIRAKRAIRSAIRRVPVLERAFQNMRARR